MARRKSYNRADALKKARNAFWAQGYEPLGVRAIEETSGINRFAIQTEFGGKEGLFLEALDDYAQMSIDKIIAPLAAGGLDTIGDFFRTSVEPQSDDMRRFGCLMVNTVVENAGLHREKLEARTRAHYERLTAAFRTALGHAREAGELAGNVDIDDAAKYLLTLAMGIQVYIRMTGTVDAAKPQVKVALDVLDTWRRKN